MTQPNAPIPKGYKEIEDAQVYMSDHEIVITGVPNEDDEGHNCDHMGCSSINHVIYRGVVNKLTGGPYYDPT
jgi:hypothetical protein